MNKYLICNKTGIYLVSSDMSVTKFKKYWAIGSGQEFALGSIYSLFDKLSNPKEIAKTAVESAINFQRDCGGKIRFLEIAL